MEDRFQPAKSELAKLGIKDIFFKYLRFLPLFVISVALSLVVAYLYLRYTTPIYRTTGSIIIKDDNRSSSNDKLEKVLANDGAKNIQNEIEFLKSKQLMERVVTSRNLNFYYFAIGKVKELNVYKSSPFYVEALELRDSAAGFNFLLEFDDSRKFRVNGEGGLITFGQVFKNANGVFRVLQRMPILEKNARFRVVWNPTAPLAAGLAGGVVVAPKIQGTGILTLTLEQDNPQLAVDVINQLMNEYQEATLEEKNRTNQRTQVFIDERLRVVTREIDSINARRLAFQRTNEVYDAEAQSGTLFNNIDASQKAINEQSQELEVAQMVTNYLGSRSTAFTPVPSTLGLKDPTLSSMVMSYNAAQLERKALVDGNVPATNPYVQQKEEQIEKLRQNILESLRNLKASINLSLQNLRRQGGTARSQIMTLPAKQQMLEDIKRQQESKLAVYKFLMEKKEETAIALAANIASSQILENAEPNYTPVKPNRRSIQLFAVLIGLALPALFIFIVELLNDKVTSRNDIEKITAAPVLGDVGHSYGKDNLVVTANNRKVIAEQFRILRSNLQYVLNHFPKPVILVTSSFSGEGKSFISTNMGAVMALSGKRTIVLEFDIRKPKVLSHLGMPKRPGLTNYLLGKVKREDLPVPVPGNDKLFVLPCGPIPPNPAELLLDEKFNELFDYLRSEFDVVVMDTAPVGMVSDALTLSKFANCTLYIVRQGHTFKKQIALIDELYQSGKLPKISIVLNDVKVQAGYGYGYGYGRYGYGYGYGSGYFEEEEPPVTGLGKWLQWMDMKHWKKKRKRKATA